MKIKVKRLAIKPGSIWLFKKYSIFKRIWSFITRKKLPYNKWSVFDTDTSLISVDMFSNITDIIVEPKKRYTSREINRMQTLKREGALFNDEDLLTMINIVRPNTVDMKGNIDQLISNKYYYIRNLSNKAEWDEYIYGVEP